MIDFTNASACQVEAFDFSDVDAEARQAAWLERQLRRAMEQRRHAFHLGYQTACERSPQEG